MILLFTVIIRYFSVGLPQLTRATTNDENQSADATTTTDESTNNSTAAALLQQIKHLVNANNHHEDENQNENCTSSPFQRTVNWTFENMKMLIGSDLPIFGDEQHPAVSLRLRYFKY